MAENAVISRGAHVGGRPEETQKSEWGIAVVGGGVTIGAGARVAPKEMVGEDRKGVEQE